MKIFDGKKFQNFSEAKNFLFRSNKWLKIMFCLMSAVELVGVKICWVHEKAHEMRMQKLLLGLSLAQILPEKINKMIRMVCPGRFSLVESVHLASAINLVSALHPASALHLVSALQNSIKFFHQQVWHREEAFEINTFK